MGRRSVDEHAALIRSLVEPALARPGAESVRLADALGRTTTDGVRSPIALPPFRNSQMDGFAARAADLTAGAVLPVAGVIAAAAGRPAPLEPGTVVAIMTGAPVPDGADCVVPEEHTDRPDHGAHGVAAITVRIPRAAGDFVREAGVDLRAGAEIVARGTRLAPRHLAAIAAAGLAGVDVVRRPRLAVITTGDEVVAPGTPLGYGQVPDANGTALAALIIENGGEIAAVRLVGDDPAAFAAALEAAVGACDVVVTAGGISHGDFEVVRQVLEPRGADVTEIAMQPGGPQLTAIVDGVPVLGFPGNPVSVQVSFTVFLRPLLRAAAGLPAIVPVLLPLAGPLESPAGRRQWLRGIVHGGRVEVHGGPGSHLVAGMAVADVLIDVPAGTTSLSAGAEVTTLAL